MNTDIKNENNRFGPFISKAVAFCGGMEVIGLVVFAAGLAFSIAVANYAIFVFTFLFLLIRSLLQRENPLYKTGLELPFLSLYVAAVASSIAAYFIGGPEFMARSFKWVYNYTSPLIFFVIAYSLPARGRNTLKLMLWLLVIAAAANSCYAVYQFISRAISSEHYLDVMSGRPGGTMFYMTYGGVMVTVITIAVAVILKSNVRRRFKIILLVLALVGLAGLAASMVRSAWIGLAVSIFIMALIADKRVLLIFPVVAVIAFLAAPRPIIERVESVFEAGTSVTESEDLRKTETRLGIWRNSLKIAADYPIFGVGMHNTIALYDDYTEPGDIETEVPHAHNNYIQIVVERGVLGAAAFVWLIVALFGIYIRLYRRARSGGGKAVGLAGIGVMSAFLVEGIFEYTFGDYEIMAGIYALAGIAVVYLTWEERAVVKDDC
ncbi:MAG: O-antigen ligase family protein [bacterium]|nr:O-antigen ligase family protein [bacterium]